MDTVILDASAHRRRVHGRNFRLADSRWAPQRGINLQGLLAKGTSAMLAPLSSRLCPCTKPIVDQPTDGIAH